MKLCESSPNVPTPNVFPAGNPAFSRISPVHIDGSPGHRLMVVLRTSGCEYAKRTGGCTVCGFMNHAVETADDGTILSQLDRVFEKFGAADLERIEALDLLTLGSFLNDREVSSSLRCQLLSRVARLKQVRRVSFESRAEYITSDKLDMCRSLLGERRVELGIGLESADDHIRNKIIRKELSLEAFLTVVNQVANAGLDLLVYLLIKPPGLSESQAIVDAVASARFVFQVAAERGVQARVAFEPVFICANTELENLYRSSQYRLVNLWSVIEVIRQIHNDGGQGNVFIGLSDEGLSHSRLPWSCDRCHDRLVTAIEDYNAHQDLVPLDELKCECRSPYLESLERGTL